MKIRVEREGGLAGIRKCTEMNSEDLPSDLVTKVRKIMEYENLGSSITQSKGIPKGAADLYQYKISFQDGSRKRIVECNEYDIHKDLKLLVRYLEKSQIKYKIPSNRK